jgi:hypothetical protein
LPSVPPRAGYEGFQFSERDAEVIKFLEDESLAAFSFEGLRRRLGTHSETLSRTLHRLEEQSVLERAADGYHVTDKGKELMSLRPISATQHRVPILRSLLPRGEYPREVISSLKGRWFGPLRWLGYSEEEGGTTMKWVTEDGAVQIDAIFSDGELAIEGNVREGKDLAEAIKASYQLVGYLSRIHPAPVGGKVAFFSMHN